MCKRKIYSFVLFLFCALYYGWGEELTPEQKQFRSNIMQFLAEEGFMPTIDDSDNSVNFKKEGDLHWITVGDSGPFYLEFHRSGLSCNNADMNAVIAAVNEGNKKVRCAKAILNESSISFAVELYCHSAEEFRYIFYKCLDELASIEKTVSGYYDSHQSMAEVPFTIKSVSVANADTNGKILSDYGEAIYSYKTQYITPKLFVDAKEEGKYDLYIKFYTPNGLSTGNTSPAGYSYKVSVSMESGFRSYVIIGWGGSDSGHWKSGDYRFEFYYKDRMIGEKEFTIK